MEPSTLYFLLKAFVASAELAGCSLAFLLNLDVDDTKERSRIVIIGGGIVIPSILILVFGVWWGLLVTPIYAYLGAVLYGVWLRRHFGGVDRLCSELYKSLFEQAQPPEPEPPPASG